MGAGFVFNRCTSPLLIVAKYLTEVCLPLLFKPASRLYFFIGSCALTMVKLVLNFTLAMLSMMGSYKSGWTSNSIP